MADQKASSVRQQIQSSLQSKTSLNVPRTKTPDLPPQVVQVSAEAFSIAQLERKMMFLNEPQIQNQMHKAAKGDLVRQIWRIHAKQMEFEP